MSTETKELRSQILQLKQDRAIYEMKVEQKHLQSQAEA